VRFEGTAHRYGRDVDTDVIIPARYLNTSDPAELAKHCMEDIDAAFVAKVKPGDIIVADENFGCGSSREHAPIAISTGLPIMESPDAARAIRDGDIVAVDADAGTITDVTTGAVFTASPFPPFIKGIIERGGLIASVRERVGK
jgi:3-isopropylmalate/(R)-2-methylmalate dehydratase small subunit